MVSDVQLVVKAIQERGTLKPSPHRAKEALEAFQRIVRSGCLDESDVDTGENLINESREYLASRIDRPYKP